MREELEKKIAELEKLVDANYESPTTQEIARRKLEILVPLYNAMS